MPATVPAPYFALARTRQFPPVVTLAVTPVRVAFDERRLPPCPMCGEALIVFADGDAVELVCTTCETAAPLAMTCKLPNVPRVGR